jgi:membrane protease YdiL (CAAX protease family)
VGVIAAFIAAMEGTGLASHALHLAPMYAAIAGQVAILLVALLFALLDGEGFRSIGLAGAWKAYDAGVIPGIIVVQFVGSILAVFVMMGAGLDVTGKGSAAWALLRSFAPYSPRTFLLLALVLAALAGIGEEILFRGYLITRLEKLGLPGWACILASAFIFGLAHWPGYGFWMSISKAVFFGIPTGVFFWHRRSLGPVMVAHVLMDYMAFVLVFIVGRLGPPPGL